MKRMIKVIILVVLLIPGLWLVWGFLDFAGGANSRVVWNHTWGSGEVVGGFLTGPDGEDRELERLRSGNPPERSLMPGVLLIHDAPGLTVEIATLANGLAADGYVVLAPDAFRGKRAVSRIGERFLAWFIPTRQIEEDLYRAWEELKLLPQTDSSRIALVGLGAGADAAAKVAQRTADLSGTVLLYGRRYPQSSDQLGELERGGPVLFLDNTDEYLQPLSELLEEAGITCSIHIFEDAPNRFLTPEAILAGTSREKSGAAAEAWMLLRGFIAGVFRSTP